MNNLKFETYSTTIYHIIMKDGLFYDGANIYGSDKDGVLRVAKCKWSENLHEAHLTTRERSERILKGIKKYDADKNSRYEIVQIRKQTLVEKVEW